MTDRRRLAVRHPVLKALGRKDALAGLMFIGFAALGLWMSRNYPVGTALRMGTGYVPRLLCWALLGFGVIVLTQGLRGSDPQQHSEERSLATLWPVAIVAASLVAFGLAIERLGLVISILLLVAIGSFADRNLRPWETLAAAAVLIVISWAIFILGLGLTIPVWPED
jgi:hypothetical protein